MLNRLRIILVCLLALALPVQGFAAATMLFCAGGHHHGAIAPGAGLVMGTDHEHPAGTAAHRHDHGHADDAVSPHDEDAQASAEAGHAHQHVFSLAPHSHGKSVAQLDGKCSACSACCTSVALPTTLMAFQPVKVGSPLVAIVSSASAGFLTGGQDRPPRPFLA